MTNASFPCNDKDKRITYYSYLLRLWCAEETESWNWRASLEDTHTGERIGFPNLERLFAFLMERENDKSTASQIE